MKKLLRKPIIALLTILLLIAPCLPTLAQEAAPSIPTEPTDQTESVESTPLPAYLSITGRVTGIVPVFTEAQEPEEGASLVSLELADGGLCTVQITPGTYFPALSEIETGDTVTAYYKGDAHSTMIFPPRYRAAVLIFGLPEGQSVKVDRFRFDPDTERLISEDDTLALNLGEFLNVVNVDGIDQPSHLDGDMLAVVYGRTTRSIPAQTTPLEMAVLP